MSDSWSEEELYATVKIYLDMHMHEKAGHTFNKKAYYRQLSQQFGRTEKAFEYRMQNISFIFSLLGRTWVSGLKPAKNVGRKTGEKIESLIARIENRPSNPYIGFEIEVSSYQNKKRAVKPIGTSKPKISSNPTVSYERSAQVKAWVLNRAGGICEYCQQQAPFTTLSGSPYLEVHHVKQLSLGGSDTISNCVALCPNCHRSFHYSIEHELLVDQLYQLNTELIRE